MTVEVYTNEGWEKPHLHLYNDHFKCAIRLDVNQYFLHGQYTDKLNDAQAKIFDKFMREKIKRRNTTKWDYAVDTFNLHYDDHSITVKEQPDYTKLNYTSNLKDEVNDKKKGNNGKSEICKSKCNST